MKRFFALLFLSGALLSLSPLRALAACSPPKFAPGVKIPGLVLDAENCTTFADYFGAIYRFAISVALTIAVIMTVVAGYIYATSGGDPGRLGLAKEILTSTVIGLVVLVLAALIIRTIVGDL